jgi:mRNA interferase MazF
MTFPKSIKSTGKNDCLALESVYFANLDLVVGSEQGKTRPVIVISEDAINQVLPIVNVIPISSRKSGRKVHSNEVLLPSGTGGLEVESIALCFQIRTLDKSRLTREIGRIDDLKLQESILNALRLQLGL